MGFSMCDSIYLLALISFLILSLKQYFNANKADFLKYNKIYKIEILLFFNNPPPPPYAISIYTWVISVIVIMQQIFNVSQKNYTTCKSNSCFPVIKYLSIWTQSS